MLGPAAGFGNQRHDVGQGLARLRDKIRAVEFLLGIPADLAGEEHHAAFGHDAVGKALWLFPVMRVEELMWLRHVSGSSRKNDAIGLVRRTPSPQRGGGE